MSQCATADKKAERAGVWSTWLFGLTHAGCTYARRTWGERGSWERCQDPCTGLPVEPSHDARGDSAALARPPRSREGAVRAGWAAAPLRSPPALPARAPGEPAAAETAHAPVWYRAARGRARGGRPAEAHQAKGPRCRRTAAAAPRERLWRNAYVLLGGASAGTVPCCGDSRRPRASDLFPSPAKPKQTAQAARPAIDGSSKPRQANAPKPLSGVMQNQRRDSKWALRPRRRL